MRVPIPSGWFTASLVVMHALSSPPAELRASSHRRGNHRHVGATATRRILIAETIGHLVPPADATGWVHSVFARACNLTCNGMLLTLCTSPAAEGPTTLRLVAGTPVDWRDLFEVGEPVAGVRGVARTRRTELRWMHARIWRPDVPRPLLPRARIAANLRRAEYGLARHRCTLTSVVDRQAAPVIAALRGACGALDREAAQRAVAQLIGWGEGLTPAGDDFLVGLLAGLDAMPSGDEPRRRLRDGVTSTIAANLHRTTAIAAHFLRLAAGGHYVAPLVDLRQALLGNEQHEGIEAALRAALAVGATSGADTVSGLLAGLAVWMGRP